MAVTRIALTVVELALAGTVLAAGAPPALGDDPRGTAATVREDTTLVRVGFPRPDPAAPPARAGRAASPPAPSAPLAPAPPPRADPGIPRTDPAASPPARGDDGTRPRPAGSQPSPERESDRTPDPDDEGRHRLLPGLDDHRAPPLCLQEPCGSPGGRPSAPPERPGGSPATEPGDHDGDGADHDGDGAGDQADPDGRGDHDDHGSDGQGAGERPGGRDG